MVEAPHLLTPAEYLESEKKSKARHEFLGGALYAVKQESRRHDRITRAIYRKFANRHVDVGNDSFLSDMMVCSRTFSSDAYYYPDVVVGRFSEAENSSYMEFPSIIFEVISPSTEVIDRREKLVAYMSISSVKHYVIVSQNAMEIEWLYRAGGIWKLSRLSRPTDTLEFPDQGAALALSEVYQGIEFPAKEEE